MNKLLLHPATEYQLQALIQTPSHAVLISGATGSGKQAVARTLIAGVLGRTPHEQEPYMLHINGTDEGISIEDIRKIRDFLSRRTTGKGVIRRVVLILNAQTMQTEAQNALLKKLEEPPADTIVILTTDDMTSLKATIRSRTQQLLVLPVSEDEALNFFKAEKLSKDAIQTAYYMSEGRVGLMAALLEQNTEHPLVEAISQAKTILKMSPYERLLEVDGLSKQKEQATLLLKGMERVVLSGMRQAAQKKNDAATRKFYSLGKQVSQAQTLLSKNVNAKLALTSLFLEM